MKFWWQTQPLEPVDQIVGEQQQMKIGNVGKEVTCGNFAQGVVSLEFPDDPLHACSVVVEAPEVERFEIEVRNQHLVMILAQLEQRELLAELFRLRSPDDYKAVRTQPASRLIVELGCLYAVAD